MTSDSITITILRSGFSSIPDISEPKYSSNRVAYRGEVITLTPEQVESTRDLHGNSWTTMTAEEQLERWGHVNFAQGDVRQAEGIRTVGEDDLATVHRLRQRAMKHADAISDPNERRAAHAAIRERFGAPESSQRTLSTWDN